MAAFEVVALGVAAGGLGAVVWALLPWLRPPETPAAPDLPPDVALALQKIHERVVLTDDDGTPWLPSPLRPGEERLPADLRPWEGVVVLEGPSPALVPLGPCLLEAHGAPDLLEGRRQGRPIRAVRIEGDVYLDLFEAARLLPVLGVELAARGLDGPLALYREGEVPHESLVAAAPWLVSGVGGRVVPEGGGARTFRFHLAGQDVEATAWMPTVARGITEDGLRWAGTLTFAGHTCTGATSAEDLERLGVTGATDIGWTRRELLELAAILQQLESQDVDLSGFLLEVFADRRAPRPDLHAEDQTLVVTALLNWVGAAHRRAGRPRAGLAALEAALAASSPVDDDSRGDVHHNRGLCWMDLRDQEPGALDRALQELALASRCHPTDPDPWVQTALVHHLRGDPAAASEAWLQAATRVPNDPERQAILMANAQAPASGRADGR